MSLDAVKILGINITTNSKSEILEYIQKYLSSVTRKPQSATRKPVNPFIIVTPNPEQIVSARSDPYFSDILNRADVSLPDGIGLVLASRILSQRSRTGKRWSITKVIPGIEFMEILVSWAAKRRVPIALIGGRGGLAVKTLDCLSKTYPGLRNSWAEDGPDIEIENRACLAGGRELRIMNYDENLENKNGENHASIPVATIRKERYFDGICGWLIEKKVQIVFVGLGAPKQEYYIDELSKHLSAGNHRFPVVFMSVGGSFDEIAGNVRRAPQWVGRMGLKWLWRLTLQPWRIGRQLALFKFVALVVRERYSMK